MNKYLITALVLAGGLSAAAQSKVDLPLAAMIGERTLTPRALARSAEASPEQPVAVIVTFADAAAAADYAADNDVIDCRADMCVVALTPSEINALAARSDVRAISAGVVAEPKLEVARAATGVSDIQAGTGLDHGYTGKGVIAGLFDTGLDPNHANFQANDENRVKVLWTITGNTSAVTTYDTVDKIAKFTTDSKTETHGTHVLGIIAGGFKGNARLAYLNDRGINTVSNRRAVPYYGVATDAELAVCCGTFESTNTITAAGLIADYAAKRGMPAVMNLSLGSNIGPHDGTSATNRYLAEVGKDMIICMSAGNEGGTNIYLNKTFTASDNSIKTSLSRNSSVSTNIDIWASNSDVVTFKLEAYNTVTGAVPFSATYSTNLNGGAIWLGGATMGSYSNITYNDDLNKVFGANASFRVSTNVDPINNRYNVYVTLDLGAGESSRNVVPVITVTGKAGQRVDMYTNKATFMSNGIAGCVDGNDQGTISDMSCGDNVLSVGAYINRAEFPTLSGKSGYGGKAGDIAPFSSYGKRFDGKQLPDVVGPGMGMISSYSYYYVQNLLGGNVTDPEQTGLTANYTHDNRASYWAEMSGTSMSSPFVAGVMALWLEADPTLTIDRVKEVLAATCDKDASVNAAPERWGYGKINALAGIKYILNGAAVSDVATESKVMVNQISNGVFDIYGSGATGLSATLYSLGGSQAASATASGTELTLDASHLAAGVYVLRVQAGNDTDTRKVVIR
ncbi:MAG: S8 family peptidase [Muribaculaceae bacterium]|nr:S8 family peptidase [Muribaculaceae bacterium]